MPRFVLSLPCPPASAAVLSATVFCLTPGCIHGAPKTPSGNAHKATAAARPAAAQPAVAPKAAPALTATAAATEILYTGAPTEAIQDLRDALAGFKAGGIQIEKTDIGTRTGQEFFLARKGEKTYIKYTTGTSLENAIYTLLDTWGFHWYGPGENWFVKPASIPGGDIAAKWVAPTFRNRSFFGTGGLDFPQPTPRAWDPTNTYKAGWYAWKRRNRFNADFRGAGHAGTAFYLDNKALLNAHPEWFNSDSGKQSGRLKIEIPAAVEAYRAWIKKKYGASSAPFIDIGVDPEDGRGGADDPLPPDGFAGIAQWNHADKWWWLANEVSKDFPENESSIVVSMYAYGDGATNALTPKFKLRKNVYPVIIPYAFQKAYLPAQMVKEWASKIEGQMGLYDYWNITQWSQGLPQFDLYGMKDKLDFWNANKVNGIYVETTDAAGPMGHGWWIAGQLEFDLSKDFDAVYSQYLKGSFGKAAPAMKKMYDRWARNPQGAGEVNLSLADLAAAEELVPRDSPEWKRINELKSYVHFMALYYTHDGTQESKDRLFEYLFSINHLYMVQTAAFLGQGYISPLDKGNITPAGGAKRLTPEEIDAQFREDLKNFPKAYDLSEFKFDFAKAKFSEPIPETAWRFGRSTTAYIVPTKSATIDFDAGIEAGELSLTILTDDGPLLETKVAPGKFDYQETLAGRTWNMKRFKLKVDAGQKYYFRLRGGFSRFKMNSEVIVYNSHGNDDFDNYAYPPHYLYIPKGCTEIIFEERKAAANPTGAFFAPDEKGKLTVKNYGTPTGIKDIYRVTVQPEWQGKVIACSFGHTSWAIKNLPNVLAMQPFEYKE